MWETIRRILAPLRIRTCVRPHLYNNEPVSSTESHVAPACSKVYVGQTTRTLEHRLKKHRRALASGNTAQSAVAEHAVEQMHVINWNEAEVVARHRYYRQRCTLKAWHIHTEAQIYEL